jgi:hypothetical protein
MSWFTEKPDIPTIPQTFPDLSVPFSGTSETVSPVLPRLLPYPEPWPAFCQPVATYPKGHGGIMPGVQGTTSS